MLRVEDWELRGRLLDAVCQALFGFRLSVLMVEFDSSEVRTLLKMTCCRLPEAVGWVRSRRTVKLLKVECRQLESSL